MRKAGRIYHFKYVKLKYHTKRFKLQEVIIPHADNANKIKL